MKLQNLTVGAQNFFDYKHRKPGTVKTIMHSSHPCIKSRSKYTIKILDTIHILISQQEKEKLKMRSRLLDELIFGKKDFYMTKALKCGLI